MNQQNSMRKNIDSQLNSYLLPLENNAQPLSYLITNQNFKKRNLKTLETLEFVNNGNKKRLQSFSQRAMTKSDSNILKKRDFKINSYLGDKDIQLSTYASENLDSCQSVVSR